MKNKIDSFTGEFEFLSNFYPAEISYEGLWYPTTEHAFQAAKTTNLCERQKIRRAPTPGQAKRIGRSVKLRSNWERIKNAVMKDIVRKKFRGDEDLKLKLLQTGDRELVEGNTWGDTYWGVDQKTGKGKNILGKILMGVRKELRNEH